jgi:hypothetical protein
MELGFKLVPVPLPEKLAVFFPELPTSSNIGWVVREKWVAEGKGRVRCGNHLGIFRREGDRLTICITDTEGGSRPTQFKDTSTQTLIILKPVKPPGK